MRRYVSELAWIGDEWSPYMERWIMLMMMMLLMLMMLMLIMVTMQLTMLCNHIPSTAKEEDQLKLLKDTQQTDQA